MESHTKVKSQRKLCLRRNNSDSAQTLQTQSADENTQGINKKNEQENKSNESENVDKVPDLKTPEKRNSMPNGTNDSLADFKSPPKEATSNNKPILSKFKIDVEKPTKKKLLPKSKGKKQSDPNQRSLSSSFFKNFSDSPNTNSVKIAKQCPICLKAFYDEARCNAHMKTCAVKNKVTTKQLLDAQKLQEKQEEERKGIGLLAGPAVGQSDKKKSARSKKKNYGNDYCNDSELEYVLALSKSKYEADLMEFEEAALLAGVPEETVKEISEEEKRKTLTNFGFTTNKPIEETNKSRKKKFLGPSILQTRSKEDKDRILTERIACILTGDDAFTQLQLENYQMPKSKFSVVLKSQNLLEILQMNNILWRLSQLVTRNHDFYVKELKPYLVETSLDKEDLSIIKVLDQKERSFENLVLDETLLYDPVEILPDVKSGEFSDRNCLNKMPSSKQGICGIQMENLGTDSEYERNVLSDWRETLNDSSASDVIIFLKNSDEIFTHKLVFHVRCSNILLNIEPYRDSEKYKHIKEKLDWPEVTKPSALSFLEFIYCGNIVKNVKIFDDENLLSQVRNLARLYQVKDLFNYLRKKQSEIETRKPEKLKVDILDYKQNKVNSNTNDNQRITEIASHSLGKTSSLQMKALESVECSIKKYNSESALQESKRIKELFEKRRLTESPDLFESESEDENLRVTEKQNNAESTQSQEISDGSTQLQILMNLIEQDNHSGTYSKTEDQRMDYDTQKEQNVVVSQFNINEQNTEGASLFEKRYCDSVDLRTKSKQESHDAASRYVEVMEIDSGSDVEERPVDSIIEKGGTVESKSVNKDETLNELIELNLQNLNKKTEKLVKSKSNVQEYETNNLLLGDFTPKSSKNLSVQQKAKSDLSMFINKIRRQNERSLLDSDSDIDSPIEIKKPRNPFLKRLRDDSYNKDKRKVISLLEEDVLKMDKREAEIEAFVNDNCIDQASQNISTAVNFQENDNNKDLNNDQERAEVSLQNETFEQSVDETFNESELSMYSKYKKNNKDNSIEKYREKLKEFSDLPLEDTFSVNIEDAKENIEIKAIREKLFSRIKQTSSIDNDVTLVSDSDDEHVGNRTKNYTHGPNFNNDVKSVEKNLPTVSCEVQSSTKMSDNGYKNQLTSNFDEIDKGNIIELSSDDSNNFNYQEEDQGQKFNFTEDQDNIYSYKKSKENEIDKLLQSSQSLEEELEEVLKECRRTKDKEGKCTGESVSQNSGIENEPQLGNLSPISICSSINESSKDIESDPISKNLQHLDNVFKECSKTKDKQTEDNSSHSQPKTCEVGSKSPMANLSPISIDSHSNEAEVSKEIDEDPVTEIHDLTELEHFFEKETSTAFNSTDISLELPSDHKCFVTMRKKNKQVAKIDSSIKGDVIDLSQLDNLVPESLSDFNNLTGAATNSSKHNKNFHDSEPKKVSAAAGNFDSLLNSPILITKNLSKDNLNNKANANNCSAQETSLTDQLSKLSDELIGSPDKTSKNTSKRLNSRSKSERNISNSENKKTSLPLRISQLDDSSLQKSTEKTKKLKAKSVSENNFSKKIDKIEKNKSLQKASSFATPKQRLSESFIYSEEATPPINYDAVDTPRLHRELKKFGFKAQPRSKATLLLQHIYEETHPIVSAPQKRVSSASEDEGPPPKKQNVQSTSKKKRLSLSLSKTSDNSSSSIIPEEMDFEEKDKVSNTKSKNPVNIKEAFNKLLVTNKELHNKVLTYTPLGLEDLHITLKNNGCKCKINDLMDFLDEECITFQVQNNKGRIRTRRTKK